MDNFLTNDLPKFISAVGFPIVVAGALYYQNTLLSANYQKLTQQLQEKIDNNTLVLNRLVEKLHQDVVLEQTNNEKNDNEKGDSKWLV